MNAAERIYQASTREDAGNARLAERLAYCIEDDIALRRIPAGDAIGSLQELSRRYSAGRAATREAMSLLERRGLGRLRPGPCGGFIVDQPRANMIGTELADYFRATGIDQRQMDDARQALSGHEVTPAFQPLVSCLQNLSSDFSTGEENGARREDRTLSASLAVKLAAEILQNGKPGDRLGSEWDLCERYNVGRLTIRQAICLLKDTGLVECKRGRGNGLVIRNRRGTGAIRLLLAYLIGNRLDVKAVGTALFQLNRFVPALAVSRASAEERERLRQMVQRLEASETIDRCDLLSLVHYVSRLSDNPIIDLFSRCLAAYEARFHPSLRDMLPVDLQANYFRLVRQLLEKAPFTDSESLNKAKAESALVMLEMSRSRPL